MVQRVIEILKEHKQLVIFLGLALILLMMWVVLSTYFYSTLMEWHFNIIKPQTKISAWLLNILGYETEYDFLSNGCMGMMKLEGTTSVCVGSGCSGLELFLIFAGFIIIFRGSIMSKIWFLPAGLAIILLLNILRIAGLALILYYAPEYMEFNHKYTFVIIVYGAIFLMWLLWVNKFATKKAR